MAHSQTLIQLCVRQNKLLEVLDHFNESIELLYHQIKLNHAYKIEKAHIQLRSLQKRLLKELEHLRTLLQRSSSAQFTFKSHFERILQQTDQLAQSGSIRWNEKTHEEWRTFLKTLSEKADHLRDEIKNINLKETLNHMAEAVFVEHFDSLGAIRVVQWPRKIWHVAAAFLIIAIYLFLPGSLAIKLTIFGSITAALTIADISRLLSPKINGFAVKVLQKVMRKEEVSKINSMTFFALSTFLACLLFPKGIAILSILFLGLGDALASIVGVYFGKHKFWKRYSVEGSGAFFIACFSISFLYPIWDPNFKGPLILFAFLGGLIGMVSEWLSFRLDDNFVIPIVSAILLNLVILLM